MSGWLQDLKYALRGLRRAPGFTAASVVALGVGIGATTGVFGLVRTIAIEPLAYDPQDRMVRVWPSGNLDVRALDLLRTGRSWTHAIGYARMEFVFTATDRPTRTQGAAVSSGHFAVTGGHPHLGRSFTAEEGHADAPVLVSHGFWQRELGGDPNVLGRSIGLARGAVQQRVVIGVMPAGYRDLGYAPAEVWVPLPDDPVADPATGDLFVTAVLGPGISLGVATDELRGLAAEIRAADPERNGQEAVERASVVGLKAHFVPDTVWGTLSLLLTATGLVFAIACGNVANLMLVRGRRRTAELALRTALGAGRRGVRRLVALEAWALGAASGVVGVLAAAASQRWALGRLADMGIPRVEEVALGGWDSLFAGALALVAAGVIGGLITRAVPAERHMAVLQRGTRGYSDQRARYLSRGLVGLQVALATIVTVSALLMFQSRAAIGRVDPGFDAEGVLGVRVELSTTPGLGAAEMLGRAARLRERAAAVPGVSSVEWARCAPLSRCTSWTRYWREDEDPATTQRGRAYRWTATPGLFEQLGVGLEEGSLFDGRIGAMDEPVVVVSRSMADELWPGTAPLGQRIRFAEEGRPTRVIGVVGDVLHLGPALPVHPTAWVPMEQYSTAAAAYGDLTLMVGSRGQLVDIAAAVRSAIWELEPRLPLDDVRPLAAIAQGRGGPADAVRVFLGLFTVLAVLLAFAGVYGIASHSATLRMRDDGIRLAIGASPTRVLGGSLGESVGAVGGGVLVGILSAPLFARGLQEFLFEVQPADPASLATAGGIALAVGLLASLGPAVRSANTTPTVTLSADA